MQHSRSFQPVTLMHWAAAVCVQWFVTLVCAIGCLCTSHLTGQAYQDGHSERQLLGEGTVLHTLDL